MGRSPESVPEIVLKSGGHGAQFAAINAFFLECDLHGQVLWMSSNARNRLGEAANLRDALPGVPGLDTFLDTCKTTDTLAGVFFREHKPPVPVELSCVLRAAGRVLLSLRIRERTSDQVDIANHQLAALQSRTLEKYFRLLRVQQTLDSRLSRARRNPAVIITEQLERERARLARELHTGVGQSLSAIRVHIELIEGKSPELPVDIRGYLDQIAQLTRDAVAEVSAVSRRLHPLEWQGLSLTDALRTLWEKSGIPERFQSSLNLSPLPAEPSHPVRVALYRIAQEGISNIIRHSGATVVFLSLQEVEGWLVMRIEDNGGGFDTGQQPESGGLGLRTMRDQVRILDGTLHITSGAHGTKLEVKIPIESADE